MRFDPDFTAARDEEGRRIRFTRSEARALACMARHSGQVLTRAQILDAISGPGSDRGDRTVDFLVNRLRRKLRDSSAEPRFIATRYGEGYVWVAGRTAVRSEAEILVGPLRGLDALEVEAPSALAFAEGLRSALSAEAGAARRVGLDADHDPKVLSDAAAPEISMELSFLQQDGSLHCVIAVREGSSGRMRHVRRHAIRAGEPLQRLAAALMAHAWRSLVDDDALQAPLPVAMHVAAGHPDGTRLSWADNDRRLTALSEERPDDPAVGLLRAAHLHTKYVQHGWDLFVDGAPGRHADEVEIERLVLNALPFLQDRPDDLVMAAKLLHFLRQGYEGLAFDMAEGALPRVTAPAASLAMIGQLRTFRGDVDAGIELLTQAAGLCERGSELHAWVLAMLCQATLAAGGGGRLTEAHRELVAIRPRSRFGLEIMLADPARPSMPARAAAALISRRRARAILANLWYITGRLFADPRHAENLMRPPVTILRRRFGSTIVPSEIVAEVPTLDH